MKQGLQGQTRAQRWGDLTDNFICHTCKEFISLVSQTKLLNRKGDILYL